MGTVYNCIQYTVDSTSEKAEGDSLSYYITNMLVCCSASNDILGKYSTLVHQKFRLSRLSGVVS